MNCLVRTIISFAKDDNLVFEISGKSGGVLFL